MMRFYTINFSVFRIGLKVQSLKKRLKELSETISLVVEQKQSDKNGMKSVRSSDECMITASLTIIYTYTEKARYSIL